MLGKRLVFIGRIFVESKMFPLLLSTIRCFVIGLEKLGCCRNRFRFVLEEKSHEAAYDRKIAMILKFALSVKLAISLEYVKGKELPKSLEHLKLNHELRVC